MAYCSDSLTLRLANGIELNNDINYTPNMGPSQTFVRGGRTYMIRNIINEVTKYYIVDDVTDNPDLSSVTDDSRVSNFRACYIDAGLAAISHDQEALERNMRRATGGKTKRNKKHRKSRKHLRTSSRK